MADPIDQRPPAERDEAERQEIEAEQRSAVKVEVVHKAILREGRDELGRGTQALAWSGLAAGMSMSFSFLGVALLTAYLPDADWSKTIARLGYSLGFLVVILGRQQLFTENTLTVILPLMEQRTREILFNVGRVWGVVLTTNIIGGVGVAAVLAYTDAVEEPVRAAMQHVAAAAVEPSFWTILLRGVFAGWLIALLVWILPSVDGGGKVAVIVILTYTVGLAHFSHSIAGTVEASYAAFNGDVGYGTAFLKFLPASLVGNILGGVSLTAAINHAQVAAGRD